MKSLDPFHNWSRWLDLLLRGERGQTMAEYAILLGVIALVVLAVAVLLGSSISNVFSSISHHL
jgi:Flp pilus assembly pilin Flp